MAFTTNQSDQTFAASDLATDVAREVAGVRCEEIGIFLCGARTEHARVFRAEVLNLGAILRSQRALRGQDWRSQSCE
jgi:hypothetical protein